ncbi:MAG: type II secretion system F family protein [Bacteroidota bacterium]
MFLELSLVFLTVFMLIVFLSKYLISSKEDVKRRIDLYIKSATADFSIEFTKGDYKDLPEGENRSPLRDLIEKYGKKIEGIKLTKLIETELQKGDVPLRGYEFIFLTAALTFGLIFLIFVWNRNLISMTVAGLMGLISPLVYLRLKQQQKLSKFNNQIGDALVMVSNSLKAGYGFLQAIDMVAKEMAPPIKSEFARSIQEINLGVTTEEALIHLTERVPSADLDLVVTAMLIQRQIGGNLSEILDNISQTIRERITIKGEVKALTAQGRLSGWIIGILPAGIGAFLLMINPNYLMKLFTDPRGKLMLVYAAAAELTAVLIIRKIITIKV